MFANGHASHTKFQTLLYARACACVVFLSHILNCSIWNHARLMSNIGVNNNAPNDLYLSLAFVGAAVLAVAKRGRRKGPKLYLIESILAHDHTIKSSICGCFSHATKLIRPTEVASETERTERIHRACCGHTRTARYSSVCRETSSDAERSAVPVGCAG